MSPDTTHPVVVLLSTKRQRLSNLEARINVLRKHIRDLNTDSYGDAGATLMGRRDLAGGNYKNDKGLQAQQKVVYWKIDRTFEHMCKQLDDRLGELYLELDNVCSEQKRNATRVQELETEIDRDGIQVVPTLAYSTALHTDNSIPAKPTGFLDLPAELRNEIYKLSGCLELAGYGRQCWCFQPARCECYAVFGHYSRMTIDLRHTGADFRWDIDAASTNGNVHGGVNHQPSLTRVSRQVRTETLAMYYGNLRVLLEWQSICYQAAHPVYEWLRRIGKQTAALIKNFEVRIELWWSLDKQAESEYFDGEKAACMKVLGELGIVMEQCEYVLITH
ncbi:unnamed protein product [Cercospora beticola]|nr:unnamed protein product [Cercospora beticola]